MTDANAKTPTDADIMSLAYDCSALPECVTDATLLVFARAVLAKWGAQPVAAPRNAALYDPDDVAFPIQHSADGTDALPPELTSTAKPASTAAMEVVVPIAPAREPLTVAQVQKIVITVCDSIYPQDNASYSEADSVFYGAFARAIEHHHGIK